MLYIIEMGGFSTTTSMLVNATMHALDEYYSSRACIIIEHIASGFPQVYVEVDGEVVYWEEYYGSCNRAEVILKGLNALFKALKKQGIEWRF